MGENLIAFGITAVVVFIYMVIGTVVTTFIFNITNPDDDRYIFTMFWPLMCGVCVIGLIGKVTLEPLAKRLTDFNRKRLENKEEKE